MNYISYIFNENFYIKNHQIDVLKDEIRLALLTRPIRWHYMFHSNCHAILTLIDFIGSCDVSVSTKRMRSGKRHAQWKRKPNLWGNAPFAPFEWVNERTSAASEWIVIIQFDQTSGRVNTKKNKLHKIVRWKLFRTEIQLRY